MTSTLPTIKDYEIIELLGSGSFGNVYKVKKGGTYYAVKEVTFEEGEDVDSLRHFEVFIIELNNLLRMKGKEHIVQLADAFIGDSLNYDQLLKVDFFGHDFVDIWHGHVIDRKGYLVLNFFQGSSIESCYIPAEKSIRLYVDIADVILDFNSEGYVHGDIKGPNLLYNTETNDFCIVDLGAMCQKGNNVEMCVGNTPPIYEVPDVKQKGFDPLSYNFDFLDSYAYGVLLYVIISKMYPFVKLLDKNFPMDMITSPTLQEDLILLNSGNEELDSIVMDLISYDPNDRITLQKARDRLYCLM